MTEIKRTIIIEAPISEVFMYASDYNNWTKFFDGVSNFKPITEITRGNGAKFIYKAKMFGLNIAVGTEIQEFNENEGWVGKSFKGMVHQTEWRFKESNDNTEFTYILNYKFPLGKYLDKKIMEPAWINIIEKSLQNLKRIMEKK